MPPEEHGQLKQDKIEIPCELVVPAIGQSVSYAELDSSLDKKEGVHLSTMEHVYIGGMYLLRSNDSRRMHQRRQRNCC